MRTAASAAGQPLGEGLTLEIFEHEEVDTALVADVVERADVRVIERRDRARLAVEALAQLRVARERRADNLDRDEKEVNLELGISGFGIRGADLSGSASCRFEDIIGRFRASTLRNAARSL